MLQMKSVCAPDHSHLGGVRGNTSSRLVISKSDSYFGIFDYTLLFRMPKKALVHGWGFAADSTEGACKITALHQTAYSWPEGGAAFNVAQG